MVDKTELTSAFADGELSHKEVSDLLVELYRNDELRGHWQRYHLIGEALRKNLPSSLNTDLSSRVTQALENEPTVLSPALKSKYSPTSTSKPKKRQMGLAVAASVVAVGMVSFFTINGQNTQIPEIAEHQQKADVLMANVATPAPTIATKPHVVLTSDSNQSLVVDRIETGSPKLKSYILEHEYSTSSTVRRGLPSGVRVVTFSNDR